MNTYDMKIKALLTEESIKNMMKDISPEDIKKGLEENIGKKTKTEIEVEIKKYGGENNYIKSLIPTVIRGILLHKAVIIAGGFGAAAATGAVLANSDIFNQFSNFTKLKADDVGNMDFLTDSQKELLTSFADGSAVDSSAIVSNVSVPDVDASDILSNASDSADDLVDGASWVIETILSIFGLGFLGENDN